MKKRMFTGWKDVFSFTFIQNTKTKTFKNVVVGISLLLFVIFFAINLILGFYSESKDNKKDMTIYEVEKMILINDTLLDNDVFSGYKEYSACITEAELVIESNISLLKAKDNMGDKSGIIVKIYQGKNDDEGNINYMIDVYSTENISDKNRSLVGEEISKYFDNVKYAMTNADKTVISLAMSDVISYSVNVDDEEESMSEILAKIFVPMIFVLVIYMMVLLHGQSISKTLVTEKNSKLMEMLLTSVKPYAIVFGKVFAMYLIAVMEMTIWIVSGILGFAVGNKIAGEMFENYSNPVIKIMDIMNEGSSAFTVQAYVMAVIAFAVGFLFYCVLSALLTSNITKTEELANGSPVFQIIVVIGFMASYFIPLMRENTMLVKVLRYVPITSVFMLPSDVILGSIGIVGTIVSVGILFISTFFMIIITGKIYKKKVF